MTVSIIVAMSEDGVIGKGNALPWHLAADLRRFKSLTMGHHLIVGRKTFESIGRPLPGRKMIVVTRQPSFAPDGVEVAGSIEEALRRAADDEEVFVAGGADIYRQTLAGADRLYVTLVHARVDGDARFPPWEPAEWTLISREDHDADEKNEHPWSFLVFDRLRDSGPQARRSER